MNELRLDSVVHRYPGLVGPALQHVSVTFNLGQVCALTGPSGSGKSTLLSVIGLLMPPTSGRVWILEDDAWHSRRKAETFRRDMFAWVLQNSACLEARPAIDNVALGLLSRGSTVAAATNAGMAALADVGLSARTFARASELSNGELQRVTIARALLSGRPFILCDEPTGQLDTANTAAVAKAFRACAQTGRGVIVATHDNAIAGYCDRVLMLSGGSLQVS